MIAGLDTLAGMAQEYFLAGFAVFMRIGGAMALLPALGETTVPVRVRLAVTVALTSFVTPIVAAAVLPDLSVRPLLLLGTELVTGLSFGFSFRVFVYALQMAGSMAAQSTSLSQILGGNAAEPLPAIGHILVVSGLALAMMNGLHLYIVEGLIDTYRIAPAGTLLSSDLLAEFGVRRVAQAFSLAFSLAAPFVVAAFVYNLALGAINRAMPQLMVVLVGAPAITGAGMALLAICAPTLLEIWLSALTASASAPFGAN